MQLWGLAVQVQALGLHYLLGCSSGTCVGIDNGALCNLLVGSQSNKMATAKQKMQILVTKSLLIVLLANYD